MRPTIILTLAIVLLIFSISFVKLNRYYKAKEQDCSKDVNAKEEQLKIYKAIIEDILSLQKLEYIIEKGGIAQMVQIEDRNRQENFIHNLPLRKKFIFYFDANMCESCVSKSIVNLQKMLDIFVQEDIFIFVKGYKKRVLFDDTRFAKFDNVYWVKDAIFKNKDAVVSPVMAYVDMNGELEYVHCMFDSIPFDFDTYYSFFSQFNINSK